MFPLVYFTHTEERAKFDVTILDKSWKEVSEKKSGGEKYC